MRFSAEGLVRARLWVAALPDVGHLYVEGLLRRAGEFPAHAPNTDTCQCRECFEVMFQMVREEYLDRSWWRQQHHHE